MAITIYLKGLALCGCGLRPSFPTIYDLPYSLSGRMTIFCLGLRQDQIAELIV